MVDLYTLFSSASAKSSFAADSNLARVVEHVEAMPTPCAQLHEFWAEHGRIVPTHDQEAFYDVWYDERRAIHAPVIGLPNACTPDDLVQSLWGYKWHTLVFGPEETDETTTLLSKVHSNVASLLMYHLINEAHTWALNAVALVEAQQKVNGRTISYLPDTEGEAENLVPDLSQRLYECRQNSQHIPKLAQDMFHGVLNGNSKACDENVIADVYLHLLATNPILASPYGPVKAGLAEMLLAKLAAGDAILKINPVNEWFDLPVRFHATAQSLGVQYSKKTLNLTPRR